MKRAQRSARHLIGSERGSSLITLLGFALAVAVTHLAILSVIDSQNKSAKQVETVMSVVQLRQSILSYLENDKAWQEILDDAANGSLSCVKTGASCTAVVAPNNKIPVIKDVSGAIVYNSDGDNGVAGQMGFKANGQVCDGFSTTAGVGDQECIYRVEVNWLPDCASATAVNCVGAPVEITGRILRRAGVEGPYNAGNYDFKISH